MNLVVVSNRHSCEKNSRSGSLGQGGTARAGAGLTFRAGPGCVFLRARTGMGQNGDKILGQGALLAGGSVVGWRSTPSLPGPLCCWREGCGNGEEMGVWCASVSRRERVCVGVARGDCEGVAQYKSTSRTSHLAIGCDKCNIGERCSGELPVVTGHV